MAIKLLFVCIPFVAITIWLQRVFPGRMSRGVAAFFVGYGVISTVVAWSITYLFHDCHQFSTCMQQMDSRVAFNMGAGLGLAFSAILALGRAR